MNKSQPLKDAANIRPTKSTEDMFRILVATDIHLGYGEKDSNIADDSFTTFDEILQIARIRNVDFILLAGDLFHDAQPSMKTMNECIRLLRLYLLGDREITFDFLSNQAENFPNSLYHGVNYEDSNLNISIPLFTIHGNHDDLINNTSALDILSSTGLINYFGQWKELEKIKISPLVIKKGNSKIALYGLNHIPDRRLHNLIHTNRFNIQVPELMDSIFCMFVLHQNRADRGARNYIMEKMLPSFLNLVIWGHEHDCRIDPEPLNNTFISQPGSSVATSLCEGEANEKKVGILEVYGKEFKMSAISLRTVRPFIFRSIEIKDYAEKITKMSGDIRSRVEKLLVSIVKDMIDSVKLSGHTKQPTLPLIRLRVNYDDNQYLVNTKRFGQNYISKVANPEDMLLYKKNITRLKAVKHDPDQDVLDAALKQRETQDRVEDVVGNYFKQINSDKDKLKLLNLECLTEACQTIVDREDEHGAFKILEHQYKAALKFLKDSDVTEDRVKEGIALFKERESKEAFEEAKRLIEAERNEGTAHSASDDDSNDQPPIKKPAARGRGRGRGAGTSTRGRKASPADDKPSTSTRSTRGGRGKKTATTTPKPSIVDQLAHRSLRNQSKFLDSDAEDD